LSSFSFAVNAPTSEDRKETIMKLTRLSKLVVATIVACFLAIVGCTAYSKLYEYSSAGKAKVELQARTWATDLGYKVVGIAARNDDTDGDGYVSVTINVIKSSGAEERMAVECKKAAWVMLSYGCRETSLKLDAMKGNIR
jgi:hypothetical protein